MGTTVNKTASLSGPTWQQGKRGRGETAVGRVAIQAPGNRGGGSDLPEWVTLARLSPGAGGEVMDGAWETKPRPSVVIWVSGDDYGGGGGSPEGTRWRRAVNLALEALISLVSYVYVGAGEWRVQW